MAFSPALFVLGLAVVNFGAIATVPTPPVITSDGGGATATVDVNTGDTAVTTVTATGTGTKTFSIVGGDERLMFGINSSSGALVFGAASVDGNYSVTVAATSDWGRDTQAITVAVAAAPSYTGPLDLVPGAVVAYSQRAMTDGSTADAITIRRSSDDATQTFALSSNVVSVSGVVAFLGIADGLIESWKDLSGNGIHLNNTDPSAQPMWSSNGGPNSTPALSGLNGTGNQLTSAIGISIATAITSFHVVKVRGGQSADQFLWLLGFSNSAAVTGTSQTFNKIGLECVDDDADHLAGTNTDVDAFTLDEFHIIEFLAKTGTLQVVVDGAVKSSTPYGDGIVGPLTNVQIIIDCEPFYVRVEDIIYDQELSDPNRLLIRQNMATYYNVPLS